MFVCLFSFVCVVLPFVCSSFFVDFVVCVCLLSFLCECCFAAFVFQCLFVCVLCVCVYVLVPPPPCLLRVMVLLFVLFDVLLFVCVFFHVRLCTSCLLC